MSQQISSLHKHTFVELQCFIQSESSKSIRFKLPSPNDWKHNLQSILIRIPSKFKCLSNMHESQWMLSINNIIINKQDPVQFGELLTKQIPPAVIKIVQYNTNKQPAVNNSVHEQHFLRVNYKSLSMRWIPMNNNWDDNYNDLITQITNHFKIHSYRFFLQDIDECEIIDGNDLYAVWNLFIHITTVETEDIVSNNSVVDINIITEEILSEMKSLEIDFIEEKHDIFKMSWAKACNAISHEMWPKLASAVKSIVNDKNINEYDINNDCINKVITILKEERHLAVEERQYLCQLLKRGSRFNSQKHNYSEVIGNNKHTPRYINNGLTWCLLMDIFDV
eukprot:36870_1